MLDIIEDTFLKDFIFQTEPQQEGQNSDKSRKGLNRFHTGVCFL